MDKENTKSYTLAEKTFIIKVAMTYIYTKNSSYRKLGTKYKISQWKINKILNQDLKVVAPKLYEKARKTSLKNKERSYAVLDEYRGGKLGNTERKKLQDMRYIKG